MKIYLYILNTLADWEIAYLLAELESKRYLNNINEEFEIVKISSGLQPVKTMGGMIIKPDQKIEDIDFNDDDAIILPGADTWMEPENTHALDIIENIRENVIVAAICGATLALASRGILDKRSHTSNDLEYLKMFCKNYKGEKYYSTEPVVVDQNLITASGLAPLEFTYQVLKKLNVMKSETLENWYLLYNTRDGKYFHGLMESLS